LSCRSLSRTPSTTGGGAASILGMSWWGSTLKFSAWLGRVSVGLVENAAILDHLSENNWPRRRRRTARLRNAAVIRCRLPSAQGELKASNTGRSHNRCILD
jgi:hypothetical protein